LIYQIYRNIEIKEVEVDNEDEIKKYRRSLLDIAVTVITLL